MKGLTRVVPFAYRFLRVGSWARSRAGERLFLSAFFAYKKWIEDPHAAFAARHPEVFRGGHILDVGANVGYTASLFARYLSPPFKVYAFEPEELNFARLNRVIAKRHLGSTIVAVKTAIGDRDGTVAFRTNPDHPGDHQIDETAHEGAIDVPITTLDKFTAANHIAPVKFVKIDVQGHELAVTRGMSDLVERGPAIEISFEYSGLASSAVVDWYRARGFRLSIMRRDGELTPLTDAALSVAMRSRDYCDIFATRREIV
jgi:FkbM family methyltransferase